MTMTLGIGCLSCVANADVICKSYEPALATGKQVMFYRQQAVGIPAYLLEVPDKFVFIYFHKENVCVN